MLKPVNLCRPNLNTMRRFLPFILLLCAAITNAQQSTKLDLRTALKLQKGQLEGSNVSLLVKGNLTDLKKLTAEVGGIYKYGHGSIASVSIPATKLNIFQANPAVLQIENASVKGTTLMDTARLRNNIDSIHMGYSPLVNSLKGTGVVVGIIDGGIYWQHGDFRNPADNTTRIRYIWDQEVNLTPTRPQPYNYGSDWNWLDIDLGNCGHVPPLNDFGHGTCVAGIAAGNSHSLAGTPYAGTMTGVAPESDIIAVRIKNDDNFTTNVADAVDYIFKKADALGKPCVINTSIGTYYGSHDGGDLATQMIETLLDERSGRVLVAAGGNAGHIPHHLAYDIPADSAYTFFKYNSASQDAYFDLWADTATFNNAYFTVGCNDAFGSDLGRLGYYMAAPILGVLVDTMLYSSSNTALGRVYMLAQLQEGKYHVEFLIENISNSQHLWRLQTQGSGRFDLWSSAALTGSADMTSTLQNIPIQFTNYRHPDSLKTIVSSWQCSDKVITVGNYSNRAGYLDRDSNYQDMTIAPYNETIGKRFATSSFGPTRDNRLKPDIMATGSTTVCTGDSTYIALAVSATNRVKVSITKKHVRNGGTSMASPIVAGVAALYLQKRPNATYQEVKDAITNTARKDNFTGSTDNPEYGHGKINGFAAVTYAGFIYGTTDTACINYNPAANVDTGGCQLKVYGVMDTACLNYNASANTNAGVCLTKIYGCTDPAALNYDSTANIENSTCQYPNVGINEVNASNIKLSIMPNPFNSQTTFNMVNNGYNFTKGSIRIVNQLGAIADEISIGNTTATYNYSNTKLAAGVYFYTLILDGKRAKTGKLIVE